MNYSGIIFDLDGTLVDSLEDLTKAMNYGLAGLDLPTHSAETFRKMVGDGVTKFAQRALGPLNQDKLDDLLASMTAYYYTHCLENTRPYEGMAKVIQALHAGGVKLSVLTNKNHPPSVKVVETLFGRGVFSPIIGMEPGRQRKPDPASVFEILAAWSLAPRQVLFVGDSDIDIKTASAANLDVAGASWGYRSKEVLKEAGAQIIVDTPCDLYAVLGVQKH